MCASLLILSVSLNGLLSTLFFHTAVLGQLLLLLILRALSFLRRSSFDQEFSLPFGSCARAYRPLLALQALSLLN